MKVNDLLSLEITDVALGGKAVARSDGRVVFVDRGLPGDRITARVRKIRRDLVEARLETIEAPSPMRIEAPCRHTKRCGGCRLQSLAYDGQLALKQRHVRETLRRIGGIADPNLLPIRPAPEAFRYRNKMEFTFHPDAYGAPVLGLHERGFFDRVFEIEECLLPSELTVEIVRRTQRFAVEHAWAPHHPGRHQGVVRFLVLRHLPLTRQCGVHLIAASKNVPGLMAWAHSIAALSPEVRTVTLGINDSRSNVAFAESHEPLVGDGLVEERLLGLSFEAGANAFLQTNSRQAEALYSAAIEAASLTKSDTVLDLYCGTGTLTLLAARDAALAVGVESVPDAVERALVNAGRNGIENVRFVTGDARRVMREWARGERQGRPAANVIVVDPPRAGLHPRVVQRVAEFGPERVVYVSCNPATLARDLKDFAALGYALEAVQPFDMFPHTPHIECVARLIGPTQ